MIIKKNYLVAYTDENAPEREITAKDENEKLLFKLNIRESKTGKPFYLDVERFKGKSVFFYQDDSEFCFDGETDDIPVPEDETQSFRPEMHYTVPYGWLNDPNGLIFKDGKYHIFCQHNPLGTAWGNMHWFHSVTEDFINFEHIGDALFPDASGTMFSGSAICDEENVSGLGKGAILLYYTIAEYPNSSRAIEFSQGLAYSTDKIHFKKYEFNPIVPNIKGENRDPKVVFVPEMNAFVMALYLDKNEYCLLKSNNLLNWERFQTLNISGDGECPDLYYIEDCKKWVFSGASDYYVIGHFDKSGFIAEQKPLRFYRELDGRYSYAAQSFSGTKGRILRLTWENVNPENGQCFCGQLSVPFEMKTVSMKSGAMRLKATLCSESERKLKVVHDGSAPVYYINGSFIADFSFSESFNIDIDGYALQISVENNTVSYNNKTIPLTLSGKLNLKLIVDKMSIEILADDGLIFSVIKALYKNDERTLKISGGKAELKIFQI